MGKVRVFKTKPVQVAALQWDGDIVALGAFVGETAMHGASINAVTSTVALETSVGRQQLALGDWLIKSDDESLTGVVDAASFDAAYDEVDWHEDSDEALQGSLAEDEGEEQGCQDSKAS